MDICGLRCADEAMSVGDGSRSAMAISVFERVRIRSLYLETLAPIESKRAQPSKTGSFRVWTGLRAHAAVFAYGIDYAVMRSRGRPGGRG